jgi:hypothetical protein
VSEETSSWPEPDSSVEYQTITVGRLAGAVSGERSPDVPVRFLIDNLRREREPECSRLSLTRSRGCVGARPVPIREAPGADRLVAPL